MDKLICGIDEAGRGPLAGPVTAAAVVLGESFPVEILNDSKKLSEKARESAAKIIYEHAAAWGIGWADHNEIDKINILEASLLAMRRAFLEMQKHFCIKVDKAIVDGTRAPEIPVPCEPVIRADAKIHSVMAASILAKTARDAEMRRFALIYPQYKYEKHKGYPTKEHRKLIACFGASPIQRLSFKSSI